MVLVKTELEPPHLQRNADDFAVVRSIAESGSDGPVLMLNMNRYSLESGFPDRGVYQQYISGLGNFLEGAGAKLLWRFPVLGRADQAIRRSTRSSPVGIRCTKYFSISTRRRALRKTSV